jgi:hypothetical protein
LLLRQQNVQLSSLSLQYTLTLILAAFLKILLLLQQNIQWPPYLALLIQSNRCELKKLTMKMQTKNAKMLGLIPGHQKVCVII